jgi:hypothetical protein
MPDAATAFLVSCKPVARAATLRVFSAGNAPISMLENAHTAIAQLVAARFALAAT